MSQPPTTLIPRATPTEAIPFKRSDIAQALETLAKARPNPKLLQTTIQPSSSFLALPGEIRNSIYRYCLDIDCVRVPRRPDTEDHIRTDHALNLLRTCRQIYIEARSLLEQTATVYLPVTGNAAFELAIHRINRSELNSLSPAMVTSIQAFANFWDVRFHLHAPTIPQGTTNLVAFDRGLNNLFARLRQALLIFTSASPKLVPGRSSLKRHATVHFDHYFILWKSRVEKHQRKYTLFHLINIMKGDTSTNWQIRYYVGPCSGAEPLASKATKGHLHDWNEFVRLCEPYENITLTMEIYGPGFPEGDDRYNHTREITPSTTHWPTYPEDVPWRK